MRISWSSAALISERELNSGLLPDGAGAGAFLRRRRPRFLRPCRGGAAVASRGCTPGSVSKGVCTSALLRRSSWWYVLPPHLVVSASSAPNFRAGVVGADDGREVPGADDGRARLRRTGRARRAAVSSVEYVPKMASVPGVGWRGSFPTSAWMARRIVDTARSSASASLRAACARARSASRSTGVGDAAGAGAAVDSGRRRAAVVVVVVGSGRGLVGDAAAAGSGRRAAVGTGRCRGWYTVRELGEGILERAGASRRYGAATWCVPRAQPGLALAPG